MDVPTWAYEPLRRILDREQAARPDARARLYWDEHGRLVVDIEGGKQYRLTAVEERKQ